jgi:three-Cys-motif partner protein
MTSNDTFFQGRKPAAVLKHAVFSSYANPFFSMVGSGHPGPMWLIDGYAGPGRYAADGAGAQVDGSPIVALELALKQRRFSTPRDVRCAFIEARRVYFDQLARNVQPYVDTGLHVELFHGSVADHLPTVWAAVGDSPVLTFIDPFGVSAVANDQMTGALLAKGRRSPSEVLVNINIEAISRHGGCLQWDKSGAPEVKPSVKHDEGIELSDMFFGGQWWRASFLAARDRTGDANRAALTVVNEHRSRIHRETGASSLVVPIRRSPTGPILFHFTLFYRHPAAAYKFADAAAKGTALWRDVFRQKDLEDELRRDERQPSLFGSDDIVEHHQQEARARETRLRANAVAHIEGNIRTLVTPLNPGSGVQVAENIEALLGDYLSLAGQPEIIRAWDSLARVNVVRERDKSEVRNMWRVPIVKR